MCHSTLLKKLRYYDIEDEALNLIATFLNHRTLHVKINGVKTCRYTSRYGVPRGFIHGPFSFLIYMNQLLFLLKLILLK